jgi:uncharacterized protein
MKVDLNGGFEVAAAAATTFAFITTPESFAPVLPYFRELKDISNRKFTIVLEVGVPQIRGTAEVTAELIETHTPKLAVYKVKGRHALGMMDSIMTFSIAATPSGSSVTWKTESVVSGTLASLAQGILIPLAKRQIKSLVKSVHVALGPTEAAPAPQPANILGRGATSLRGLFGKTKTGEGAGEKLP